MLSIGLGLPVHVNKFSLCFQVHIYVENTIKFCLFIRADPFIYLHRYTAHSLLSAVIQPPRLSLSGPMSHLVSNEDFYN